MNRLRRATTIRRLNSPLSLRFRIPSGREAVVRRRIAHKWRVPRMKYEHCVSDPYGVASAPETADTNDTGVSPSRQRPASRPHKTPQGSRSARIPARGKCRPKNPTRASLAGFSFSATRIRLTVLHTGRCAMIYDPSKKGGRHEIPPKRLGCGTDLGHRVCASRVRRRSGLQVLD